MKDCGCEILGAAPARGRNAGADPGVAVGVVSQGFGVVGFPVARGHRVDRDALLRAFARHGFGEPRHAVLGGCIGGHADAALEAQHRDNIDDAAGTSGGDHVTRGLLREQDNRSKIDVENGIPILWRNIDNGGAPDDPRIVDENVHTAQRRYGRFDDRPGISSVTMRSRRDATFGASQLQNYFRQKAIFGSGCLDGM
ncbi:hypothetical protein ASG39_21195 [Rhizobium sp. Leaf371]|nr:hypothetical protein ASG39_21195 [Rhizobium sp. Leaf371]